ncbi:MAG: hypothetical protein L3J71_02855 [Victivallaceae bacterium]|nr:hypothetical protein [Victivallaceae bacterium]
MKKNDLQEKIAAIRKNDQRYPADAYSFISHAVTVVASRCSKEKQHITAFELLKGIKIVARETFGPFAAQVLIEWSVKLPGDVGAIVFNLVKVKALSSSDEDSPEDFAVEFDLLDGLGMDVEPVADLSQIEVPIID